jgi:hypothetical protein
MLVIEALAGLAIGAAVMLSVRHLHFGIYLVPISVAIGPLLMKLRGRRPSKTFLTLYIVVAAVLFAVIAVMSPGFRNSFDPP